MYSKNYEFVIMSVTKVAQISAWNARKAFGGRAAAGPA